MNHGKWGAEKGQAEFNFMPGRTGRRRVVFAVGVGDVSTGVERTEAGRPNCGIIMTAMAVANR